MAFDADKFIGAEVEVPEVDPEAVAVAEPEPVKEPEKVDEPAKAAEPAKVEPAKPETAKVTKVAESLLTDETDGAPEQQVPVHVVAELRAKNRQLKEQLQSLQTPTAAVNAGVPAEIPDIPDDELLTGAQVKTILPKIIAAHTAQIEERIESRIAARTMRATTAQSLNAARASHEDFDQVVGSARALGMLTDQDRTEARLSQNPAEYLYQKANEKIALAKSMFAPQAATPATPVTPAPDAPKPPEEPKPQDLGEFTQEELLSDDKAFEKFFGPPKKKDE